MGGDKERYMDDNGKVTVMDVQGEELDILELKKNYKVTNDSQKSAYCSKSREVTPYIFVSFDLSNSAKLKHQTELWEKVVSELFNSMPMIRTYLNFWKFNGDELLFYKEIKSLYQIAVIIDSANEIMHQMSDKLSVQRTQDISGKTWYKVEVKTTIWIAGIDFKNNFRIKPPFGYDFIGTEIDEGFRLTKLATKGKCVIDPKIALILSGFNAFNNDSTATVELHKYFEIFESEFKNRNTKSDVETGFDLIGDTKKDENRFKYLTYYNLPHALFARNFIVFLSKMFNDEMGNLDDKIKKADLNIKSVIKSCTDRMKLVGYSVCKGIWDEKEYPIIWYSKNWSRLDKEIAYDEKIGNDEVSKERINKYYKNVDEDGFGIVTYTLLENIYRNIPDFSSALNRILQLSKLKFLTEPSMFRCFTQDINTYYILACYLEETDSVLMLLRSSQRGHLANVWDFCCQKYLTGMGEENGLDIFRSSIKKRYGIDVTFANGFTKSSLKPIALKPIYRNGYYNQGIVCFAKINTKPYSCSNDKIEEELLEVIKKALKEDLTLSGCQYYSDAKFISVNSIHKKDGEVYIGTEKIEQLTYELELLDSTSMNNKAIIDDPRLLYVSDTKEILLSFKENTYNHKNIGT